jgi:ACS family glucarate transporter-like MFS transporter
LIAKFNIVALMALFSVMSYFDRTIISVAGPGIIHEFGLSETQMGAVYSAFLLGYALMMIPGGHLTDRLGPWRTLIAMGFGAALFTGLTALGARPGLGSLLGIVPALVVVRFLVGVCTAPLYPACGRMNANWFPSTRQGLVWGLVAGGAGIGSALSPSLFAWMIPRFGWRNSFWMAGAATALLATVWAWYARDRPSEHRSVRGAESSSSANAQPQAIYTNPQSGLRKLLTNRNVVLLSLGYGTVSYFEYIFFYWIYYYFREIRHMSQSETSIYSTVIFLAWVVMTPLGGWLSDRLIKTLGKKTGRPIVPASCILLSAILLFAGTHVASSWLVGALLALSFGLASASDGPFWVAAIDSGGENVGAAGGVLNTGSNIGGFIAPVLTPFIASLFGWSSALYFGCLVAALGVAIWFFLEATPSVADLASNPN